MVTQDLAHRFFHVVTRYRYDWRVTLATGEVLLVKAAPLVGTLTEISVMVVVDAKWQGLAFGSQEAVDQLLGQPLPLAASEDPWVQAIGMGAWTPYDLV